MIKTKTFAFNPFAMNTYVLWDDNGQGLIIDAGNNTDVEHQILIDFISQNRINIIGLYLTHAHIDHILGAKFLSDYFNLPIKMHSAGAFLLNQADSYASTLGFHFPGLPSKIEFIDENYVVDLGGEYIKLLYTPGHVDGSLCYYLPDSQMVFVGDVLFRLGVGRTDLPTGDYALLEQSIRQKLYSLPNETKVFSGHGPTTSIGFEKKNNPFFQG